MKKIIALMLVVLMLISLVACAQTPETKEPEKEEVTQKDDKTDDPKADPEEVVEIVWAMQGAANETEGWNAVVDAANEKLKAENIKIVVQNIPTSDWDEYYQ